MNFGHHKRAPVTSDNLWEPRAKIKPTTIVLPTRRKKTRKMKISKKSKHNFYLLLSWAGFVVQFLQLSQQYFRYNTVSQQTIARPLSISPPSINICFRVEDLFNKSKLHELYGTTITLDQLTIEQLFHITPDSSLIAEDCAIHRHNWYGLESVDCAEFEIKKQFKQEKICYSIGLVSKEEFGYKYVMNDRQEPFLYTIEFQGKYFLGNPNYYFFFKSQHKQFHGNGDNFLDTNRHITNDSTGAGDQNWVSLSYSVYKSKLLAAPYTSKCLDYTDFGFESRDQCYEMCLIDKTIAEFDKVPFNVLINSENLNRKYGRLSEEDINNNTVSHLLREFEAVCESKCWNPDCVQEDIVPKLIAAEFNSQPGLSFYGSNDPQIITDLIAKMSLVDYLSISFSLVGFWIAFSPLTFLEDIDFLRLFSQSTTEPKVTPRRPIAPDNINPRHLGRIWGEFAVIRTMLNNLNRTVGLDYD